MDRKLASNIRKIALVAMIVTDVLMLIFLGITGHWFAFGMFVLINLAVGAFEVLSVKFTGHTLSTNITKYLESNPKMRPWMYGALICFMLSMVSLFVHWVVW